MSSWSTSAGSLSGDTAFGWSITSLLYDWIASSSSPPILVKPSIALSRPPEPSRGAGPDAVKGLLLVRLQSGLAHTDVIDRGPHHRLRMCHGCHTLPVRLLVTCHNQNGRWSILAVAITRISTDPNGDQSGVVSAQALS